MILQHWLRPGILSLATLTAAFLPAASAQVASDSPQNVGRNTPAFVKSGKSLGPANASEVIEVSAWLKLRNRSELDARAEEVYQAHSPYYHQWLSSTELASRFAPTEADVKAVQTFFASHGLQPVSVGPHNLFVRARGSVGQVSAAFHTPLHNFSLNGVTVRANLNDPLIEGPAAEVVHSVAGLDTLGYKHPLETRESKLPAIKGQPTTAAAQADAAFFTNQCLNGVKTETIDSGQYPTGTYKGNHYFATPSSPGCGYTPHDIQTAYHLKDLYKKGFDGTGQTIVIIDWCGSPTIRSDANTFSARFGLPPLTTTNFQIINYPAPSHCAGPNAEINLDVEWAHAIAPGADITLLVPPSATFQDTDQAQVYAELQHLGNVISGSYGAEELYVAPAELETQSLISEIGALQGISANFSSGDYGDFTFGFPKFNPPSVSVPAASPYATAIGGVSLFVDKNSNLLFQEGWGTNETLLTDAGTVLDPPANFGLNFGSGGGPSGFFAKPSFQSHLPGTKRELPDISWTADPFTGAVYVITIPGIYPPQIYETIGGTSWSCPMFSALWAIANQEAGQPLGQAARYVYSMPKGTITDVVQVGSPNNVVATIHKSATVNKNYSANQLAAPLNHTTRYLSAIWDYPSLQDTLFVVTFGTDGNLTVEPGWDNVTGVGTPNAPAFADYFNPVKPK